MQLKQLPGLCRTGPPLRTATYLSLLSPIAHHPPRFLPGIEDFLLVHTAKQQAVGLIARTPTPNVDQRVRKRMLCAITLSAMSAPNWQRRSHR